MKISFEIPDPTPPSEPKNASLPAPASVPLPPTVAEKLKAESVRTPPVRSDVGVSKDQAKQSNEAKPSQPAASNIHSFDLQGGVNDILDPGRGNPNVYQFVQPKGRSIK